MKNCLLIIIGLLLTLSAYATTPDTITLYFYPPYHRLDYSSPGTLLTSISNINIEIMLTKNDYVKYKSDFGEEGSFSSIYKSRVGHSVQHVHCTLPDGSTYERWTGLTGQNSQEIIWRNSVKDELGMGSFTYHYPDGRAVAGEENWKGLVHYRGPTPRYLRYSLGSAQCAEVKEMVEFFESFHVPEGTSGLELEKKDPKTIVFFSLQLDPWETYQDRLAGEPVIVGGDCTTYALGLMRAGELSDPIFESLFKRELKISGNLFGDETHHVSLQSLLVGSLGRRWVHEGYEVRSFALYDPQLIWDFLGDVLECLKENACKPEISAWLSTKQAVLRGPTEIFSDWITRTIHGPRGQRRVQRVKVSNSLDGIVVH